MKTKILVDLIKMVLWRRDGIKLKVSPIRVNNGLWQRDDDDGDVDDDEVDMAVV